MTPTETAAYAAAAAAVTLWVGGTLWAATPALGLVLWAMRARR